MKSSALVALAVLSLSTRAHAIQNPPGGGGGDGGEEQVLSASTVVSRDVLRAGSTAELGFVIQLNGSWHINSAKPADPTLVPTRLKTEADDGLTLGEAVFPEAKKLKFEFADEPLLVYEGKFLIRVPISAPSGSAAGPRAVRAKFRYQACDSERCLAPRELAISAEVKVAAADAESNPAHPEVFGASDGGGKSAPAAGPAPKHSPAVPAGGGGGLLSAERVTQLFGEGGHFFAFALIYLIGLALNLTPCVYPVIPITLGYFANQSHRRTSRTLVLALVYVLGMAAMYSVLGVVAALSGRAFGSALASPGVLVFLAAVMVALAASMFGLWEVGIPGWLATRIAASPSGLAGAGFMGLTVGIVAAPCLAPAIGGLLFFVAQKGSVPFGFAIFFTLALGLGTPFVFLALASGSIQRLPRSGEWMVWVKHLFGFMLLAMALYFLRPAFGDALFAYGVPLLALAAGVFLGFLDPVGRTMPGFRRFKAVAGVLLVAASIASFVALRPSAVEASGISFIDYEEAAFAAAVRDGRPVLIDFGAEWCLPCKELERYTFSDQEVVRSASRFTAFHADGTIADNPRVEALLKKFSVQGFPTVLFIDSKGNERADLRIIGFVAADDFRKRLESIE